MLMLPMNIWSNSRRCLQASNSLHPGVTGVLAFALIETGAAVSTGSETFPGEIRRAGASSDSEITREAIGAVVPILGLCDA